MLIDSHCHLFYNDLNNDLPAVLDRAREAGVERLVCVGVDLETSRTCLELAESHGEIFATAGIHPHDAGDVPDDYIQSLEELLQHPKVVAAGEMGLDYYRNLSDPIKQETVFRAQLELAQSLGVPVIFHNREADQDVLKILNKVNYFHGVAHCFSSHLETAQRFISLGLNISFAGNLTFKNSHLLDVVRNLPLDMLMVETDSPYLSPVPHRGERNEPGRTRLVAERVADLKDLPLDEVSEVLTRTTERLFGLPAA